MSTEEDKPNVNEPLLEKTETDGNSTKPAIYGRNSEEAPKVKRNKSKYFIHIFYSYLKIIQLEHLSTSKFNYL